MKKIAFLCIGMVMLSLSVAFTPAPVASVQESASSVAKDERAVDPATEKFYVQAMQGVLCIFRENGQLYKRFTLNVSLLPKLDRARLEHGFFVTGEAALDAVIEDYTS